MFESSVMMSRRAEILGRVDYYHGRSEGQFFRIESRYIRDKSSCYRRARELPKTESSFASSQRAAIDLRKMMRIETRGGVTGKMFAATGDAFL